MSHFRRNLVLSGTGGLLASLLLASVAAWLVTSRILNPPLPYPMVALLLALVLGGFSLAEIPLMLFAMRRLSAEGTGTSHLVAGLNALYVFFAAVYGAPVSLLTGEVDWGSTLCALSLVRFAASLVFVRGPAS